MGTCSGNCASCGGCARELVLTQEEIALLQELGQVAFLPVGRALGDLTPIFPEGMALTLQLLEKKGLISLDYDRPLKGFSHTAYQACPLQGSFALTERGQKVLELMEYQGIH